MPKHDLKPELPIEFLRAFLSYDPETGVLTWKWSRARAKRGSVAGTIGDDGYVRIGLTEDGYKGQYRAHRIAWAMMTGEWPKWEIDHRDLNRSNNAWANLRLATPAENCSNGRARSDHKKGAYRRSNGKWSSQIRINHVTYWLGTYDTEEEAHRAYCKEAYKVRGEFARAE